MALLIINGVPVVGIEWLFGLQIARGIFVAFGVCFSVVEENPRAHSPWSVAATRVWRVESTPTSRTTLVRMHGSISSAAVGSLLGSMDN
ncbi:MAG: hypothetical protein DMG88_18505 [Acidobacteria bacterium]|nr:MAG: hypothetical protein DMG88_18505 [Acidobacteriota bacterium]